MLFVFAWQDGFAEVEQFSEDATERPHVRLVVVVVTYNDLRSAVVQRDHTSCILAAVLLS